MHHVHFGRLALYSEGVEHVETAVLVGVPGCKLFHSMSYFYSLFCSS
jgi:hypothetical protein